MPCPQDARSAAIRGQNDLARTKVRVEIILTSYFCAFDTILDPVHEFTAWNLLIWVIYQVRLPQYADPA